jgi:hypothetical protein
MQLVKCYKHNLMLPFPCFRYLQVRAFWEICPPDPLEIDGLLLDDLSKNTSLLSEQII